MYPSVFEQSQQHRRTNSSHAEAASWEASRERNCIFFSFELLQSNHGAFIIRSIHKIEGHQHEKNNMRIASTAIHYIDRSRYAGGSTYTVSLENFSGEIHFDKDGCTIRADNKEGDTPYDRKRSSYAGRTPPKRNVRSQADQKFDEEVDQKVDEEAVGMLAGMKIAATYDSDDKFDDEEDSSSEDSEEGKSSDDSSSSSKKSEALLESSEDEAKDKVCDLPASKSKVSFDDDEEFEEDNEFSQQASFY